jgi:endogenous inhibitor of DNA gyrase (YacG/DUF329 family)
MRCPVCKRETDPSQQNRHRPFCSERCQMVDLGTWASEEYSVAGGPIDDHEHPDDREQASERPHEQPHDRTKKKPPN